jgi:hypothetical protein
MRCSRCDFENIPGQTRCIRCGSILAAEGSPGPVYPPRMPAASKPFRGIARRLRAWRLMPEQSPLVTAGTGISHALSSTLADLVLNIVPGLGYLLQGRFREVRLFVALWLGLVCTALFFYGSSAAMTLIGLAIGIHAWIVVRSGLFRRVTNLADRIGFVLIVLGALAILYYLAPRVVGLRLIGAHTLLTVPTLRVEAGDYLLAWRTTDPNARFDRGTLVVTHPVGYWNYRRDVLHDAGTLMVGQIVGLPGERIAVRSQTYTIGDRSLDPNAFPVPLWLQQHPMKGFMTIPPDAYFVSSVYRVQGRVAITNEIIGNVGLVRARDIRGRAFMRWLPLWRRGFIEYRNDG